MRRLSRPKLLLRASAARLHVELPAKLRIRHGPVEAQATLLIDDFPFRVQRPQLGGTGAAAFQEGTVSRLRAGGQTLGSSIVDFLNLSVGNFPDLVQIVVARPSGDGSRPGAVNATHLHTLIADSGDAYSADEANAVGDSERIGACTAQGETHRGCLANRGQLESKTLSVVFHVQTLLWIDIRSGRPRREHNSHSAWWLYYQDAVSNRKPTSRWLNDAGRYHDRSLAMAVELGKAEIAARQYDGPGFNTGLAAAWHGNRR